ncbi:MAG: hypothetical protein AAGJ79_08950 [Verrucomicrobiota bacterium]
MKKLPIVAVLLILTALVLTAFDNPSGASTEILTFRFPKAMFEGTPSPTRRPHLEPKDSYRPKKAIEVPAGTRNLAAGKTVTSSDDFPIIGDLEMITDGDKEGADGSFVELAPGKQWVQIDLGRPSRIEFVMVWHYHKNARAYDDVIVQTSNDPGFHQDVTTVFNNDHDASSGHGKGLDPAYIDKNHGRLMPAHGIDRQYIRLHSAGNTADALNHYIEVEVWGR